MERTKKDIFYLDPVFIHDDDIPLEERASTEAKYLAELYLNVFESIPSNAPKPKGKPVTITCFADSDYAGDKLTRRSRTGVLILVNKIPIMWFSKKQKTVETSTFGSEFIATKKATEMIKSIKYKLRMYGIPIMDGEAKSLGDNNSVILHCSTPESALKKNTTPPMTTLSESGTASVMEVDTSENLADLFTKLLDRTTRKQLVVRIL